MSEGVWYAWLTWDAVCVGIGILAWVFPRIEYPSILQTLLVCMISIHIMVSAVFAEALNVNEPWIAIVCGTVVGLALVTAVWTPIACLLGDQWITSVLLGLVVPLPIIMSAAELSKGSNQKVDTFRFLDQSFSWWPVIWGCMAMMRLGGMVIWRCTRKEN